MAITAIIEISPIIEIKILTAYIEIMPIISYLERK